MADVTLMLAEVEYNTYFFLELFLFFPLDFFNTFVSFHWLRCGWETDDGCAEMTVDVWFCVLSGVNKTCRCDHLGAASSGAGVSCGV